MLTRTPLGMNKVPGKPKAFLLQNSLLVDCLTTVCNTINYEKPMATRVGFTPMTHTFIESMEKQNKNKDNKIKFKEEVFFSMCWYTPHDTACVMTYSQGACTVEGKEFAQGLEWWTVLQRYPPRTFMLAPAWFQSYRPSLGLALTFAPLSDSRLSHSVCPVLRD